MRADSVTPLTWSLLISGVLGLLFFGVFFAKNRAVVAETQTVQSSILEQERQIKQLQPVVDRLGQYAVVQDNLSAHYRDQKRFEQVIGKMESELYKKMRITNLQITEEGTYTLTAVTPSYLDYAKVYASLTSASAKATFATVKVVSVARNDKEGSTDIVFTFQGALTKDALTPPLTN
jgi:hypothetical protein